MIKILSWNVNGLRAILKKNYIIDNIEKKENTFINFLKTIKASIVVLTEIRLDTCDISNIFPEYYYHYINPCSVKKGRNGVLILSRFKPCSVETFLTEEGRYIQLEFKDLYLCGVYVPNSGQKLQRLEYRTKYWDILLKERVKKLMRKKQVILCGDFNVINKENDTYNYEKQLNKVAGITTDEIENFHKLLDTGLTDVYRYFHKTIKYTYYSYYHFGRKFNKGMRIDYFLATKKILKKIKNIKILDSIYGSDHLPIILTIDKSLF